MTSSMGSLRTLPLFPLFSFFPQFFLPLLHPFYHFSTPFFPLLQPFPPFFHLFFYLRGVIKDNGVYGIIIKTIQTDILIYIQGHRIFKMNCWKKPDWQWICHNSLTAINMIRHMPDRIMMAVTPRAPYFKYILLHI